MRLLQEWAIIHKEELLGFKGALAPLRDERFFEHVFMDEGAVAWPGESIWHPTQCTLQWRSSTRRRDQREVSRARITLPTRRYPKHPLPGVGALIFRRHSILLVQRARNPLKGYWSLPGGLIESGEKIEDALKREVREETGLIVRPHHLFEIFERIIPDAQGRPEYHYILHDYLCTVVGGELVAGDDAGRAAWVPRAKLKNLQLTEGTLEVIERAFIGVHPRSSAAK